MKEKKNHFNTALDGLNYGQLCWLIKNRKRNDTFRITIDKMLIEILYRQLKGFECQLKRKEKKRY
jgi:hypothetical protein